MSVSSAPTPVTLATLEDTECFGQRLAGLLRPGDTLTLSGTLGTGKTTLSGAILRALGWLEIVPSPTYTLVNTYPLPDGCEVWHFDAYRLEKPEEILMAGWQESRGGIRLIEWPEKIAPLLPENRLSLTLEQQGDVRLCTVQPHGLWIARWNNSINIPQTSA
jgi:tRNA threonylcarbamoyladenosine biosynthesis protein TsaE